MPTIFRLSAFAATGFLCLFPIEGQAQSPSSPTSIPTVTVYPLRPALPAAQNLNLLYDPPVLPYSDSADYLRTLPGISAGRFGGHGLEPFIRGQSMTQLDVNIDGANVQGGCPNRMDPPTSYAALGTFDMVKIVRGYQTVTNGPGAPGGSVSLERKPSVFNSGKWYEGTLSGGYESNGQQRSALTDLSVGNESVSARIYGNIRKAGNYTDGDGNTVRSAFQDESAGTMLSWTPDPLTRLTLGYDANRIEDALFPGAGMDSVLGDGDIFRAKMEHFVDGGAIKRVEASFQASLVDHIMDNYSLRDPTPGNTSRAVSESNVYGGKLRTDVRAGDLDATFGIDLRRTDKDAVRRRGTEASSVNAIQSILWPDIVANEAGLSAEVKKPLAERTRLVVGARYDRVQVHYGRASETTDMAPHTPNSLYRQFYGISAKDVTEDNLGGLGRIEYDVSSGLMLFSGLSRSVRTADATERGIASRMVAGAVNSSWVGNPGIAPEKHHQIDSGFSYRGEGWSLESTAYANFVQDYILRDSARGQDGVLVTATSATIYRNIDALLAGVEMQGRWAFSDRLEGRADLAFTYGEDRDSGRALPQIPPLSGSVGLLWNQMRWTLGSDLRWAVRQGRVDTNSATGTGRDVRKTPGYAVVDLHATTHAFKPLDMTLGVSNLFDRKYASHLNRSNLDDPTEIQVNEPGRSVFLRATMRF